MKTSSKRGKPNSITNRIPKQMSFDRKELLTKKYSEGFGGTKGLKNSHAKTDRPFSPRCGIHVVLKSRLARGELSMLKHEVKVRQIVNKQSRGFRIVVRRYQNVGNHLHMVIQTKRRDDFRNFLRSVSNLLARHLSGTERGPDRIPRAIDVREPKKRQDSPRRQKIDQVPAPALTSSKAVKRNGHFDEIQSDSTKENPRLAERLNPLTADQRANPRFWDQRPYTRLIHWGKDWENMKTYIAKNRLEAMGFSTTTAKAFSKLGLRPEEFKSG